MSAHRPVKGHHAAIVSEGGDHGSKRRRTRAAAALAVARARRGGGGERRVVVGIAILLYALAKLFELADRSAFGTPGVISGHTMKHLLATAAAAVLTANR
jgi:hypothetical protein